MSLCYPDAKSTSQVLMASKKDVFNAKRRKYKSVSPSCRMMEEYSNKEQIGAYVP